MSGYETEELGRIEAALDDLVSPTSEDVWQATRPYDERAIASVAATRAGGGGVGAQTLDGVLAYLSLTGTVNSGNTIPWDSTLFDTGAYLDTGTGKFHIPADKLGIWRVELTLRGTIDSGSDQMIAFFDGPLSDSWYLNLTGNGGNVLAVSGVVLLNIPSADVWDMTIGGGSPSIVGGLIGSRVALTYLGELPA